MEQIAKVWITAMTVSTCSLHAQSNNSSLNPTWFLLLLLLSLSFIGYIFHFGICVAVDEDYFWCIWDLCCSSLPGEPSSCL